MNSSIMLVFHSKNWNYPN